jgi:hypothetical protein
VIHDNEFNLDPCGHWGSPTGWGISLWQGNQTRYIVNNTIYNTRGGIEVIVGDENAPTYISNNIVSNLNGMDYFNDDTNECGVFTVALGKVKHLAIGANVAPYTDVDYNLFYQPSPDPVKLVSSEGVAAYQAATGECAHCLQADPLFVDGANTNFNLQSGSAAIDAGIEEAVYQTYQDLYGIDIRVDFANTPRPVGANWDMGAYEFTPSLILNGTPDNQAIHLNWTVNTTVPVTMTWQINYDGPSGTPPSPITGIAGDVRNYTLTNLTNYTPYTVTLTGMVSGSPILTDTVTVRPTDIYVYLPLVVK